MGTNYEHLTAEERATLMVMRADGCIQRAVARCLGRSPSTISRELARNASCCKLVGNTIAVIPYDASLAGKRALELRHEPRRSPKLAADTALFAVMLDYLRDGWSPEQIAGRLKRAWPDDQSKTVSHETIYTALYAMPRGGLRKDLIACLRHGWAKRRPRSRGQDRRGQLSDMLSLHVRPPEVEDRLVPGERRSEPPGFARSHGGCNRRGRARGLHLHPQSRAHADAQDADLRSGKRDVASPRPDGPHRRHRLFRRSA